MNQPINPIHILFYIDPSQASLSAAAFLRLFTFPPGSHCTLLGVTHTGQANARLTSQFDRITAALSDEFILHKEIAGGDPFAVITRYAQKQQFDLVALGDPPGTYGSPFYPWFLHSQQLSERLASSPVKPLLISRATKPRLNNILFGSSGEEPARRTLEIGAKLLSNTGARVFILHVMSQLAFENSRFSDDLYYNAEAAIKSSSREGVHLSKAIEILTQAGIKSQAVPRLRHGLVLDEMMAEIKEQQIDLLVIGSHHQPGQRRLLSLMLEDVTHDLVSEVQCSVLVI